MKYYEVFDRNFILSNIPLVFEGRELSSDMQAKLLIARVAYNREVKTFEEDMKEILEGLKKEGFGLRLEKMNRLEDIDRRRKKAEEWKEGATDESGNPVEKPAMPSEEELKEAEEIRPGKEEFEKELEELDKKWRDARIKKSKEESPMTERRFTAKEYAEIIELITTKGEITVRLDSENENIWPREEFLEMIAENLVDA